MNLAPGALCHTHTDPITGLLLTRVSVILLPQSPSASWIHNRIKQKAAWPEIEGEGEEGEEQEEDEILENGLPGEGNPGCREGTFSYWKMCSQ